MPMDEFESRPVARRRGDEARQGLGSQAVNVLQALLGDVFYFRWAFAGLGAVMWVASVC